MKAKPPAWLNRLAAKALGPTFVRTYLRPLRFRSRAPYNPKAFWGSRYSIAVDRGAFVDATTIRLGTGPARARYHYNAVENAILEALLSDGDVPRGASSTWGRAPGTGSTSTARCSARKKSSGSRSPSRARPSCAACTPARPG